MQGRIRPSLAAGQLSLRSCLIAFELVTVVSDAVGTENNCVVLFIYFLECKKGSK